MHLYEYICTYGAGIARGARGVCLCPNTGCLCMCLYIHIDTCIHIYVYTYIHICIYAFMLKNIFIYGSGIARGACDVSFCPNTGCVCMCSYIHIYTY